MSCALLSAQMFVNLAIVTWMSQVPSGSTILFLSSTGDSSVLPCIGHSSVYSHPSVCWLFRVDLFLSALAILTSIHLYIELFSSVCSLVYRQFYIDGIILTALYRPPRIGRSVLSTAAYWPFSIIDRCVLAVLYHRTGHSVLSCCPFCIVVLYHRAGHSVLLYWPFRIIVLAIPYHRTD
jgi:hypothetical protein